MAITTPAPPPTSSIVFRSASQAANRVVTNLVLSRPAGVQSGDILVASIDVRGAPVITPPVGWTLIPDEGSVSATDLTKATFWHLSGANEPASYAWTFSAAAAASGVVAAYGGVDGVSPIAAVAGQANPSGTVVTAPTVSAPVAGSMLVSFFAIATNATFTPPTGMIERGDIAVTSGSLKVASGAADQLVGAGPTGTRTATGSKAAVSIGQTIVLRPAP